MATLSARSRVMPAKRVSGMRRLNEIQEMSSEYTLSHARYSEHRKKMGLSRVSIAVNQDATQFGHDVRREYQTHFIRDTFNRKECINCVPDPKTVAKGTVKCHCGELPENHRKVSSGIQEFYQQEAGDSLKEQKAWSAERDIRKFQTNAFGKIEFVNEGLGGRKPSKYIRLSDDTEVDSVIELMKDHWHMLEPNPANLVITVIGGAKNFKLDGKKKEIFNTGLVSAARTTHAWIITSGCNMGVMKAVGEAVLEGQSYQWTRLGMTHSLRCIGIAPWGYIEGKECLVSKDGQGCWNASYRVNSVIRHGHPVSLNPDHTHFILVDDGYRGRYGGVADLRSKLERKISLPTVAKDGEESGLGIPVVLVVVEGGTDAIQDVHKSLSQKIPVVLCEGTGRAADILAYAYRNHVTTRKGDRIMKSQHKLILEDKLLAAYGKTWASKNAEQEKAAEFVKIVIDCCKDEELITVFDMNKHEDLDLAILSALLKGQGASNTQQLHDQLKLALTWNRSDIAEEKIFNDQVLWPPGSLDDIMTTALIEDKVDFVRLLLQNGVVMREYLTVGRLRHLYNSANKVSHLRQLLQKTNPTAKQYTLSDIGQLIHDLMGKHDDEIYQNDQGDSQFDEETGYNKTSSQQMFPKPFREILLWAILMNRQDMAAFLWERGDEAIPSAIAASRIYESMADRVASYDINLKESLLANKEEFEKLASSLLDECHQMDPEKAAMLIERKYKTWGETDCLEMAAAANDKEFLSTVCCQNVLNLRWNRGLATHWFMILLSLLCPPLILCGVQFDVLGDELNEEKISPLKKLIIFYRAPVTKFAAHVMMYLAFLVVYSYMILFDFRLYPTPLEWFVMGWMFTFLLEEIREMFLSRADTTLGKIRDWWSFSYFNRLDMLVILLAVLSITLRQFPQLFPGVKAVYAVNCVVLFVRLFRDYSASSYFGPKLVMIKRMIIELSLYIAILLVFLLAYGISTQSLMYPVREPYFLILKDIFYYPYWQIYGELYLEELEGRTEDCLGNGTIQADGTPCPQFSWLVPVLTAAYLLIGNVLLLNLLIAIFTHIFDDVEANSIQIWKFGMYFLVVEYDSKPGLAPPFIIFEHIYLLSKWILRRTCCKKKTRAHILTESQISMLQVFEKEACKYMIQKRKRADRDDIKKQIHFIQTKVDEMSKLIEEERLLEQQHYEAEQNKLGQSDSLQIPLSPRSSRLRRHSVSLTKENVMSTMEDTLVVTKSEDSGKKSEIQLGEETHSAFPALSTVDENSFNFNDSRPSTADTLDKVRPKRLSNSYNVSMTSDSNTDVLETRRAWADQLKQEVKVQRVKVKKQKKKIKSISSSSSSSSSDDSYDENRPKLDKGKESTSKRSSGSDSEGHQGQGHRRGKKRMDKKNKRVRGRSEEPEMKELNVGDGITNQRVDSIEDKMKQLEENTNASLYNIEVLLRNAVFQGSLPTAGTSMLRSRRGRTPPVVTHRSYRDMSDPPV